MTIQHKRRAVVRLFMFARRCQSSRVWHMTNTSTPHMKLEYTGRESDMHYDFGYEFVQLATLAHTYRVSR